MGVVVGWAHARAHSVLDSAADPLCWGTRARWLAEVARGMQSMHGHWPHPVVHRDLKASNVLLDSVDLNVAVAKVADFGVAKAMDSVVADTYALGALEWSAPETLAGQFSFASDVYSFSVLMYEVLTRALPFAGKSSEEKMKLIAMQDDSARFVYNADLFADEAVTTEQQHVRWVRRRERTLEARRPDISAGASLPSVGLGCL